MQSFCCLSLWPLSAAQLMPDHHALTWVAGYIATTNYGDPIGKCVIIACAQMGPSAAGLSVHVIVGTLDLGSSTIQLQIVCNIDIVIGFSKMLQLLHQDQDQAISQDTCKNSTLQLHTNWPELAFIA